VLAVEHAGADLDRVRDHARGMVARVGPRAHQLRRAGVVDDQVLDDQAADERGDARLAQWRGGFHGNLAG
jgi:hypothetical protein